MLPNSIKNLIYQFNKLPGIGPKTAERLAFYLLKKPQTDLEEFATALKEAKRNLISCTDCLNISQTNPCEICSNPNRDHGLICVVADSHNQQAIERTGEYHGVYHILGGVINQIEGFGPETLNLKTLLEKAKSSKINEIILGLNPDLEGESTSLYLKKILESLPVKISRLARGLPSGSDIEYADEVTLGNALKNRQNF